MSEDAVGGTYKHGIGHARTIVGLMAAPVIGGVGGVLVLFAFSMGYQFFSGRFDPTWLGNPYLMLFVSTIITNAIVAGIPVSFIAGLPAHLALIKLRLVSWFAYAAGGGVIALAGMVVVQKIVGWSFFAPVILAVVGGGGTIGGVAFWLIRRPDRDAPSASPTP